MSEKLREEEEALIAEWLSGKRGSRVKILVPQRGDKERLIALAEKNASMVLQQDTEKIKREKARTTGAVKQIAEWLGLPQICRIESYDISNTSGFESVGSMVVYENGKPKKNDYRKFKIRTVIGADDYASMREVLTRRFLHGQNASVLESLPESKKDKQEISGISSSEIINDLASSELPQESSQKVREARTLFQTEKTEDIDILEEKEKSKKTDDKKKSSKTLDSFQCFPDLIMMDGGRGQVNIALEVLDELGITGVTVCGMVKDDHHRTRGLYYNNEEIPIDTASEAFRLVTRIQDETHRFAIEYHRSLRGKAQVHSILDDIPGIGAVRRRALMKKYESLDALKLATAEEIAELPEFNRAAAEQVYQFFHQKTSEEDIKIQ